MNLIEKNHLITTLENITTLVKNGEVISLVISFNTIDDNIMTFWSSSKLLERLGLAKALETNMIVAATIDGEFSK